MTMSVLTLVFLFSGFVLPLGSGFRIGAFNIKIFGPTKSANNEVMDILAKIVSRYDIVLIQEVKDAAGQAIIKLRDLVESKPENAKYEIEISDRLGRTTNKEQYAFLYRKNAGITVTSSYHFDDGDEAQGDDLYEREPFIVKFNVKSTVVTDFILVAVHTKPKEAVPEITRLIDVVSDAEGRLGTPNVVVMGDLNADCSFVPQKAWPSITIKHDPKYKWLIPDDADTTTGSTDCAYDRFILKGEDLISAVVPKSAKVFHFEKEYNIDDTELVLQVSDHYPIEFELEESPTSGSQTLLYGFVTTILIMLPCGLPRLLR